ncbi:MAG TPA: IPT/TIG domain-containing protein [Methanoregula sp.]|nr:IPT/TIG domain-containing protein [Methanoregula sp.]
MALMGISVGVPIANRVIMDYKENKARPEGEEYKDPVYASMLEENGKPSLLRLQMFLWTLASLVIYFCYFIATATAAKDISTLALPPVNDSLLFLMGLSQAGYLGSKAFAGTLEKDTSVPKSTVLPAAVAVPASAKRATAIHELIHGNVNPGDPVTILGSEFGRNKDTVMIGTDRVDPDLVKKWENSRIEFIVPEKTPPGKHALRVIAEGASTLTTLLINEPRLTRGQNNIPADIISDIWIDDPSQKGLKVPPIGYFIPENMYHFFFEYAVPAGTPSWGHTQFRARFLVDGVEVDDRSFMPGHLNGRNYGVFDYTFTELRDYTIEIRGASAKEMMIRVGKPRLV